MKTVKLSKKIVAQAKIASKEFDRSTEMQIEHWVRTCESNLFP